ncbi:MAG TPA: hypothetical protein VFY71_06895 [Planctomycetota bacterium]|nr:hypothetical protein [Planctomycetota bacterium]
MFRAASLALLLAAAPLAAQNYVETFTGGVNQGGWTFGANSAVQATGGNPTNWLHVTNLDTFAPQLHNTLPGPFAGDWRALGVHSVGVDLITISTQFAFDRECTLMLSNGPQTVYFLGSANHVPQAGTGWKSFEFTFDPASTTMPPGWAVFDVGDPDATWNAVITNVKTITFFYGDPTFFFIFDIWNVGADNIRINQVPVWTDVGHALAGAGGAPVLKGSGQLVGDSVLKLALSGAAASAPATLVIGLTEIDAPFKGGVLVPAADLLAPLVTSPGGGLALSGKWPAGVPSGALLFLQMWVADAGGPKGFAASNGLKATTP